MTFTLFKKLHGIKAKYEKSGIFRKRAMTATQLIAN